MAISDHPYVDLDNERFGIQAGIHTVGGYSAHADQLGLVNFVTRMRHWPSEIRLVHGEVNAKQSLSHVISRHYEQGRRTGRIHTSYQ